MKNFFILGRNPKLSRLEILSYLESRSIKFKEILFEENFLVLEFPEFFNLDIQELGGTIKSGKISFEGNFNEFEKFLSNEELIPEDKFNYAVFGNIEPDAIKEKFKREKRKATLKHGREDIKFQGNIINRLPKSKHSLFLLEEREKIYFGIVDKTYNYEEVEKRDMQKPVRRESLAISPRLAKILINLSGAKEKDRLLDPFCGIGGILQEALIKGISVFGIDKDREAIEDCKKNIEWLKKNYKINAKHILESKDSKFAPNNQFDAIATETPLGILLKKKPTDTEAKKIIENFEKLITPILSRLREIKKENAKIAITFPVINSLKVNSKRLAYNTGLKIIIEPIQESRPDQFISREILVFR